MPAALLAAAAGLGDVLRATPLVRVLAGLGYEVDLLLAPDHADTVALLEGAPEVRRVYHTPGPKSTSRAERTEGLAETRYDVAVLTHWARPLRPRIDARRVHAYDRRQWTADGDPACVEHAARALGWTGEIPAPYAIPSGRVFDGLAAGTVALHPGCKASWPWKKWHGFAELAAELPHVVVVGTAEDRRTDGTYFGGAYEWPPHVRDLTGTLDLPDTAALLSMCAALVSNDSGLMHLGVALGIPVFGVFGITSPAREAIPAPHMHAVTKGLPCETACRAKPWGRRGCEHHLRCLRTLTGREVAERVRVHLAPARPAPPPAAAPAMRDLVLAYHGPVADATGYGHAARAYVHALHRAGVQVRVVADGARAPSPDPLVASLAGRGDGADLHLFHGVPPQWPRQARTLPNAVGMTVWETDTVPPQWRTALGSVREVWLPCTHNVEAFAPSVRTPLFRLPHPLLPRAGGDASDGGGVPGVEEGDFLVYAIFEWQERKGPEEAIDAYLRAFEGGEGTVLLLKTNPHAAPAAHRAVAESRARHRSGARVEVRAERWSEAAIDALHRRGDCYLSLHRGEGWGYPLFEAAARGTPVVATAHSGPLDYLDADAHALVRWTRAPVRQRYAYYHPRMSWAEPDVAHAAERLRAVYDDRAGARARAARAGARIRDAFSLDAVGAAARARLEEVRDRLPARRGAPAPAPPPVRAAAPARAEAAEWGAGPVPLGWYDAGYFETGAKSNWAHGYTWTRFGALFRETAAYLEGLFPDARRYLDAGCAKGFLVRALRERGREAWGVDGSAWAIDHAEAAARPFLALADVAVYAPERTVEVATAFNLLAHLTEAQALAFLARLRPHVRTALLATIPMVEPNGEMKGNRDRSHVTLRPRAWWLERFRRAGWRQDGLHRVAEAAAARHPLPRRMGWEVLLVSPGAEEVA